MSHEEYEVTIKKKGPSLGEIIAGFVVILIIAIALRACDDRSVPSSSANNSGETTNVIDNLIKEDEPVELFEIRPDRIKQDYIQILEFSRYEHTDLDGYIHRDCYTLLCKQQKYCVGYNLAGKFTTLTGQLYAMNEGEEYWLEFYSGDTLIYTTEHLSENNVSCEVYVDISNVEFLTIYFCSSGDSGWLIAENFIVSN